MTLNASLMLSVLTQSHLKSIINTALVHAQLCKLQKGRTRLAVASDKVYQLLAHGRWFYPGTPASSITKTGRHIAESGVKHNKSNQINQSRVCVNMTKSFMLFKF